VPAFDLTWAVKVTTVPAVGELEEGTSDVTVGMEVTVTVTEEEVLDEKIAATYGVVVLKPYCV